VPSYCSNYTARSREFGITPEQRKHAEILLEERGKVVEKLAAETRRFDLTEALGGTRDRLSLEAGGQLLESRYALERELQSYSAYPSSLPDRPVPDATDNVARSESDAFDYSLPYLPPNDLVLVARRRTRDAPRTVAFKAVNPEYWQGDDDHALTMRANLANWPRSPADPERLHVLGWPALAIGVWCYPYTFDVHLHATGSLEKAAAACLKRLQSEGWRPPERPPDGTLTGTTLHESTVGVFDGTDGDAGVTRADGRPFDDRMVHVVLSWPDRRQVGRVMPLAEAASLLGPLTGRPAPIERTLQLAEAQADGNSEILAVIEHLRDQLKQLPQVHLSLISGGVPADPPILRPATADDRALFEQEGLWAELSRQTRWSAIGRALLIAAEADASQARARAVSISGHDMLHAVDKADVDAWRRIWYLCRGIAPPGFEQPGPATALDTSAEPAATADEVRPVERHEPSREVEKVDELPAELTPREREILTHWRKGKSESEISTLLDIYSDSVAKRVSELRRRFGDAVVPRRRPRRQPTDGLSQDPGTPE
jgi:DNA-binding CsgD family transcriptional regulator